MSSAKLHVLIVDDDPVFLRLIGGKLMHAGFEVLYSHDGNEAREVARRMQPDLILLDVRMSGEDGYKILVRLRSEPQTKNIPVVFLTNEDLSLEAEKRVRELGVADYIHKSVDPDEFLERIRKVTSASQNKT